MILKNGIIVLLIALASCNTMKHKKQIFDKEQSRYHEQLEALGKYMQGTEERREEEVQRQQAAQLEITADSLLYWHPDSGLSLRPGILKVKYQLQELHKQIRQRSTNETAVVLAEHLIVKQQQINNEHQVNTKTTEIKNSYRLVAILIVLLLLVIRLVRWFGAL